MGRLTVSLALLLGIFLQQPASASVPRLNSSRNHPRPARLQPAAGVRHRASRTFRGRGVARGRHRYAALTPVSARRHGSRYLPAGARTLRHLRSRRYAVASLQPDDPTPNVLIDPVPLKRFRMPPPMKGSYDSLVRQNVRAEADGLLRIEDDDALLALRESGSLVSVPVSDAMRVDDRLPATRRYCREWTAQFLADLGRVHYQRFHDALIVTSAVRTVEYQRQLGRINGNAAPAEGDIASPHLTGATIDIAKKGLSMQEIGWMRAYLMPLEAAGKLDVEEEFQQACFHITVYKSYMPGIDIPQLDVARSRRGNSTTLLASKVR